MSSVHGSQRLILTTIGQRLPRPRNVGRWNDRVSWTTGVAKVDTISTEPIIESVVYEDGIFRVSGLLRSNLPNQEIYDVLTDYSSLPRVFHNVEKCSVSVTEDGRKFVTQMMLWNFLIFRGSFETELEVLENLEDFEISFSLVQSAFMNQFVGAWSIDQDVTGTSIIRHSISVAPSVRPPQKIGDLTKRIFEAQVHNILRDLAGELNDRE